MKIIVLGDATVEMAERLALEAFNAGGEVPRWGQFAMAVANSCNHSGDEMFDQLSGSGLSLVEEFAERESAASDDGTLDIASRACGSDD